MEPRKLTVGSTLTSFPGGTFAELVNGEYRDRRPKPGVESPRVQSRHHSSTVAQLAWLGDDDIEPGSVVMITEPQVEFDDDESVPFDGLHLQCEAPTSENLTKQIAITAVGISGIPGDLYEVGSGYVAGMCWAQIDIADEEHTTAGPEADEEFLISSATGRVPIVWKPTGTGVKWCVVQLSAGGSGGGSAEAKIVLIDKDIVGIIERDPPEILTSADIELTPEEISDGYTVVLEDPEGETVTELDLRGYRRRKLSLKVFKRNGDPLTGTAEGNGGADNKIELDNTASSTEDDFYVDDIITVDDETHTITAYDGPTHIATVDSDWVVTIDDESEYEIVSAKDMILDTEITDDTVGHVKTVRYKTISVWYDDGIDFELGQYIKSDYPDYPENGPWPPTGVDESYLIRKFRGVVIAGVLVTILCKPLPAPELPE